MLSYPPKLNNDKSPPDYSEKFGARMIETKPCRGSWMLYKILIQHFDSKTFRNFDEVCQLKKPLSFSPLTLRKSCEISYLSTYCKTIKKGKSI